LPNLRFNRTTEPNANAVPARSEGSGTAVVGTLAAEASDTLSSNNPPLVPPLEVKLRAAFVFAQTTKLVVNGVKA
jgi:hypothetical protein